MSTTIRPLLPEDAAARIAFRDATAAHKGHVLGPDARPMFEAMLGATPPAPDVRTEPGVVNGIAGFWLRPRQASADARLLYLHGGGYVLGSARALCNFASHFAAGASVETFVADYRLAPEHPFPAAIDDTVAAYRGMADGNGRRIAVAGDSAGGGLALALLSILAAERDVGVPQPVAAAVMSPFVDLALSGESYDTRAEADPIFTRAMLEHFAVTYLQGADPTHPAASPIHAALEHLPPVRIDVGDDEVLLDDSIAYARRAVAAGTTVDLTIWQGMSHVFQTSLASFRAAELATEAACVFLRRSLAAPR